MRSECIQRPQQRIMDVRRNRANIPTRIMQKTIPILFLFALIASSCGAEQSLNQKLFNPHLWTHVETVTGDLNADGNADETLLLEERQAPASSEDTISFPRRRVLVTLSRTGAQPRLISDSTCLPERGTLGIREYVMPSIRDGMLYITVEGGSNADSYSRLYTFRLEQDQLILIGFDARSRNTETSYNILTGAYIQNGRKAIRKIHKEYTLQNYCHSDIE